MVGSELGEAPAAVGAVVGSELGEASPAVGAVVGEVDVQATSTNASIRRAVKVFIGIGYGPCRRMRDPAYVDWCLGPEDAGTPASLDTATS